MEIITTINWDDIGEREREFILSEIIFQTEIKNIKNNKSKRAAFLRFVKNSIKQELGETFNWRLEK